MSTTEPQEAASDEPQLIAGWLETSDGQYAGYYVHEPDPGPDPETPLSDAEHRLGQVRENAESLLMNPDPVVQWCARQVLAAAGVPVPPLPPAEARAVADLVAVEGAAAVLERRYPGTRPERLDTVLGELHAVVRAWRRQVAEAGKRTEGNEGRG